MSNYGHTSRGTLKCYIDLHTICFSTRCTMLFSVKYTDWPNWYSIKKKLQTERSHDLIVVTPANLTGLRFKSQRGYHHPTGYQNPNGNITILTGISESKRAYQHPNRYISILQRMSAPYCRFQHHTVDNGTLTGIPAFYRGYQHHTGVTMIPGISSYRGYHNPTRDISIILETSLSYRGYKYPTVDISIIPWISAP